MKTSEFKLLRFCGKGRVLFVLLSFTLLPLFILSFYNNPQVGDDYADVVITLQKGFWGAQKWWYFNLSGRYLDTFFKSLNPLVFNAYWTYKADTILFLSLLVIAVYWLCNRLFNTLDKTVKWGIISLFIFAYIFGMPSISYGIFMYTGLIDNLLPDILILFLSGCIFSYYNSINKKRYLILSCLLITAIIGLYDIQMVLLDLGILLFLVFNMLKKQQLFFPLILLATCTVFSIVSITAPGNAMRGLLYPNTHNVMFTIKETISWGGFLLIRWVPFMLLIGLMLFHLLYKNPVWNTLIDSTFIISPLLCLIACIAIPFIGLFICFWAMGEAFSYSRNGSYFYFVIGMFYFSFSSIARLRKRYPNFNMPYYFKLPAYLILVFIVFFKQNNLTRAYSDIFSGAASSYNREMTDRDNFLKNFKGDSCMLDSIKSIPNSFDYRELQPPVNDCAWDHPDFGKYYYQAGFSNRLASAWGYASFREYYHKKYIGIKGK